MLVASTMQFHWNYTSGSERIPFAIFH